MSVGCVYFVLPAPLATWSQEGGIITVFDEAFGFVLLYFARIWVSAVYFFNTLILLEYS